MCTIIFIISPKHQIIFGLTLRHPLTALASSSSTHLHSALLALPVSPPNSYARASANHASDMSQPWFEFVTCSSRPRARLVKASEVRVDSSSVILFEPTGVAFKDDVQGRATVSTGSFVATGAELGVELMGISNNN